MAALQFARPSLSVLNLTSNFFVLFFIHTPPLYTHILPSHLTHYFSGDLETLSLGIPYHTCNATKVARESTVFFFLTKTDVRRPLLGREPLWFDSCKQPPPVDPPVSDQSVFAFWVVAYKKFDCVVKRARLLSSHPRLLPSCLPSCLSSLTRLLQSRQFLTALDRPFASPFVTKPEGCKQTDGKHTVCEDRDLIQLLVHCIVHSV